MKIVHVFKTFYPETYGGIEEVIHKLASASVELGHEVTVLTFGKTTERWHAEEGYEIRRFKSMMTSFPVPTTLRAVGNYRRLAFEADILHFHYPYPVQDLLYLGLSKHKPSIVTYHSDLVRSWMVGSLYAPLRNRFLKSVNCIVATSQNYLNSSSTLRHFQDKTRVIPIGVDDADYIGIGKELDEFYQSKFPNGFVLFLGALRKYKGLKELIEVAPKLNLPLVVAGDGPLREYIARRIEHVVDAQVFLVGTVTHEQKCSLLRCCRVLVLPSNLRSEAFGIALIEGALSSKPLVSCDIGTGTSFVNKHNQTGLVVKPGQPAELLAALNKISGNCPFSEKFGSNARERYLKNFLLSKMVDSYFRLYEEVVAHSKPPESSR